MMYNLLTAGYIIYHSSWIIYPIYVKSRTNGRAWQRKNYGC